MQLKQFTHIVLLKLIQNIRKTIFPTQIAVAFSLDVCVLKIYFLHVVPACQTPLLLPPPFYRSQPWQSAMKTQDINNPVSTLAPPWWWFRYRTNNRRHCLHLAPRSTKFQRSGRNQTSFHYPVYRISPQSLPPTGEGNNSSLRNVPEIRAEPDFLPLSCIQDKSAISLP